MLTRLYIDNFRCFEKFEWKLDRKQLILGRNGTGKSSLIEVFRSIRSAVVDGERVDKSFKLSRRTRWLRQREQTFEIEAQLGQFAYIYRLVIEPGGEPLRARVKLETMHRNEMLILKVERGTVGVFPADGALPSGYEVDQNRSVVSTSRVEGLLEFRDWLATVECYHLNPFAMVSRAEGEVVAPSIDLVNFAAWYRHLVQARRKQDSAFLKDLCASIGGFDQLTLGDPAEEVRILYAEFLGAGKSVRIPFDQLSDGQRCLICLYAIMHFVVAKGGTVIIDEPDNFISLREIQPWLMSIEEMADDHDGQVILISHHPEILKQWAGPYGVQFVRDGAGPVSVKKFKGDPESSLSVAELVARGWDLD